MLQKLRKLSGDSEPIDLPPPPTIDQMFADLSKLRPNDPLLKLVSFDALLATVEEQPTPDGTPPVNDEISQKLSKLASLCDEIRDAGEFLGEKRAQLKCLARSAVQKREEVEGIVSWSGATEADTDEADTKSD